MIPLNGTAMLNSLASPTRISREHRRSAAAGSGIAVLWPRQEAPLQRQGGIRTLPQPMGATGGRLAVEPPVRRVSIRLPDDAPETEVRHRRFDGLRLASGGPIAKAVVRRAQVRAALYDVAREIASRLTHVEALLGRFHTGVASRSRGSAARVDALLGMAWRVVVGRPLPDVARHVVQPIPVGRK